MKPDSCKTGSGLTRAVQRALGIIMAVAVLFSIWTASASPVYAAGSSSTKVVITASKINVRSGPGTNTDKVGKAGNGQTFVYLGKRTNKSGNLWYKIQYTSSKVGWVSSEFSKIQQGNSNTKSTTANQTSKATYKIVITASEINIRSGPGTNTDKIGKAGEGDSFDYLGKQTNKSGNLWYKIQFNSSKVGWVSSQYSKFETVVPTTTTTAATAKTVTKKVVKITGNTVNVRSNAGLKYSKIGSAKKGKTFTYISSKKDSSGKTWYRIQYTSSKKGWVLGTYSKLQTVTVTAATTKATTAGATTKKVVKITGNTVNVRSNAGLKYSKIGSAKNGNTFTYVSTKKDSSGKTWYCIQYTSSKKGWVLGTYSKLQTVTVTAATTKATTAASTTTTTTTTAPKTTTTTAALKPELPKADGGNVLILNASLNVRSGAGASAAKVGVAKLGQLFKHLESKKDSKGTVWYKIQYNSSKAGWVSSEYAHLRTPANAKLGINTSGTHYITRKITVTAASAGLYSSPGTSSKKVATLAKGKKYTATSWKADKNGTTWYSIRYGGKLVWISSRNVSISDTFTTIPVKKFDNGGTPIIYLSPSNQTDNAFVVGNTTEQKQMYRVAEALQAILEDEYVCEVRLAPLSLPVTLTGRAYEAYLCRSNVYIAIHSNAGGDKYGLHGAFAYYFPASQQSKDLAQNVINEMAKITPLKSNVDKPLVDGMSAFNGTGYSDVRNPSYYGMVSILAEVEYHDNKTLAPWIINNTNSIARALANSLEKTMGLRKKTATTATAATSATAATAVG